MKRFLKSLFVPGKDPGRPPKHRIAIPRNVMASGIATGFEAIMIPVLVEIFDVYYLYAVMGCMLVATTISFFLNKYWVFEARHGWKAWQYTKQIIVAAGSYGGNTGLIWTLTEKAGLHYYLSFIASNVIVFFCWNYPGSRWFVFSGGHRKKVVGM